jgi:cell division protease FtsH
MRKAQQPAPGLSYGDGRPREEDILTRKSLTVFQRVRWLTLFGMVWLFLVWSVMVNNPLVGFSDAAKIEVQMGYWVFILAGLEFLHQAHYLISERWADYHQFWLQIWARIDRVLNRKFSAWTRFNTWRIFCWVFWFAVVVFIIGKFIHEPPWLTLFRLPVIVWEVMPLVFQLAFAFVFIMLLFAGMLWFLFRGGIDVYYPDDIKTRFSDVWGQDQVLERVKENIILLENPEIIEDRGGHVPGGILLWGPPGTGKTLIAEAVAGETGKPYVFVDPGAFTNMFIGIGIGILKVKSLFRKLSKLALRYGGVVVFFDEADSLGNRGVTAKGGFTGRWSAGPFAQAGCNGFSYMAPATQWTLTRSAMRNDLGEPGPYGDKQIIGAGLGSGGNVHAAMGTLQALLSGISGLTKPPPKYRILIIMATSMPDSLDSALLRPGRIDRIYKVGYPTKPGRHRTYQGYLDKVSHELTAEQVDRLAEITPYTTGAKIKDLVNEALILAIKDGRDVITWADMSRAKLLKDVWPSEDVEYITRERHAAAVHEACHAVVAYRTRPDMKIERATIEKSGHTLGLVASIPLEERFTRWRSDYEGDILSALASLAGERMFFESDSSSGVSADLEMATTVASLMEGYWGMGSTVSSYAASRQFHVGPPRGGQAQQADVRHALARISTQRIDPLASRTGSGGGGFATRGWRSRRGGWTGAGRVSRRGG